jgi:hypothetical protein
MILLLIRAARGRPGLRGGRRSVSEVSEVSDFPLQYFSAYTRASFFKWEGGKRRRENTEVQNH